MQSWLEGEYPAIEQRASAEGGEIHWGDEPALVNSDVRGRSYAPAGKTPVAMAVGGTRQKLSMIATVTNQGQTRWTIIDDAFDAENLFEFWQSLLKDAGKNVFLIRDHLHVHHRKRVKTRVNERRDQIELFYLPSYSLATQSRRATQRGLEAGDGPTPASAHQNQITRGRQRAYDDAGENP